MAAISRGMEIPETFANAPELVWGLELYLNAFWSLDGERPRGWGNYRIPPSKIVEYLDTFGIQEEEQREDFEFFIGELDLAYLKFQEDKQARNAAITKGGGNEQQRLRRPNVTTR